MDLVGKPNTTSPIWIYLHACHPSVFVQVSSSSPDRWLLSGVNPLVPLEVNESGEGFPPVEAHMWLLAGVDLLVLFEVVVP